MKRSYAVGILAALAAVLLWAAPKGETLTGSWEAVVDPGDGTSVVLRYTFDDDGTYTVAMARDRESLAHGAQVRGNYMTRGTKLYMSESLNYKIDPDVYDLFRSEEDALTLLKNSAADMSGFYPLILTRTAEE